MMLPRFLARTANAVNEPIAKSNDSIQVMTVLDTPNVSSDGTHDKNNDCCRMLLAAKYTTFSILGRRQA